MLPIYVSGKDFSSTESAFNKITMLNIVQNETKLIICYGLTLLLPALLGFAMLV